VRFAPDAAPVGVVQAKVYAGFPPLPLALNAPVQALKQLTDVTATAGISNAGPGTVRTVCCGQADNASSVRKVYAVLHKPVNVDAVEVTVVVVEVSVYEYGVAPPIGVTVMLPLQTFAHVRLFDVTAYVNEGGCAIVMTDVIGHEFASRPRTV
jgi:hypothetical protein